MSKFEPRSGVFAERVRRSFANQPFVGLLEARLTHVAPGEVDVELPFKTDLAQQYGYVHGGVITSIADAAAGYAAMTLADDEVGVLTTDLKVNFLRPAGHGVLLAQGRVIKPGRTLNIVQVDVFEDRDKANRHVQTGLVTMIFVEGLRD